jgi:hypothetical protein
VWHIEKLADSSVWQADDSAAMSPSLAAHPRPRRSIVHTNPPTHGHACFGAHKGFESEENARTREGTAL